MPRSLLAAGGAQPGRRRDPRRGHAHAAPPPQQHQGRRHDVLTALARPNRPANSLTSGQTLAAPIGGTSFSGLPLCTSGTAMAANGLTSGQIMEGVEAFSWPPRVSGGRTAITASATARRLPSPHAARERWRCLRRKQRRPRRDRRIGQPAPAAPAATGVGGRPPARAHGLSPTHTAPRAVRGAGAVY
jgi:hypothetical protein